jgi:arylsulfatase A-like enzyme
MMQKTGEEMNSKPWTTLLVVLMLVVVSLNFSSLALADRPNFIIVLTDDQGYGDLGVYGSPDIRTPELDRMAFEGLRFTDFYVASSVCSASRAALLSGQRGARNGVEGVFWPGQEGMSPEVLTLAELLRPAGYATALYGKWHLGDQDATRPLGQGFDEYFGIPYSNDMYVSPDHRLAESVEFGAGYSAERFRSDQATVRNWTGKRWELKQGVNGAVPLLEGNEVVEYPAEQTTLTQRYFARARHFISQNADRPFFLFLTPAMPHVPLFASAAFSGKSERGLYGDVIEEIDFEMGRLRRHLDELGLAENTLLLYTSDNGPWLDKGEDGGSAGGLRDGKFTNFEGGVRVPAIVAWPGTVPAGTVSREVVSTLDLFPTLAELAGVTPPEGRVLDGQAIGRHLRDPSSGIPREDYFYNLQGNIAGIRHGHWKYLRAGMASRQEKSNSDQPMLFDLASDPEESRNLAGRHP